MIAMTREKREIRDILLGRTTPDGNGKLTSIERGTLHLPVGVGDGAGVVRFFGVARRAQRYDTKLGEAEALAAAEQVMLDIGRGISLREQPEAACCLIRYVLTRPALLCFRCVDGVPLLTAWAGRGIGGWISLRRALRAFEQHAPEALQPSDEPAPKEQKERKPRRERRKREEKEGPPEQPEAGDNTAESRPAAGEDPETTQEQETAAQDGFGKEG